MQFVAQTEFQMQGFVSKAGLLQLFVNTMAKQTSNKQTHCQQIERKRNLKLESGGVGTTSQIDWKPLMVKKKGRKEKRDIFLTGKVTKGKGKSLTWSTVYVRPSSAL